MHIRSLTLLPRRDTVSRLEAQPVTAIHCLMFTSVTAVKSELNKDLLGILGQRLSDSVLI